MENQQISHYRVLRRIGGGGMGVVYAAEDLKLGRTVALKFLPEETEHDPQALDRLLREARAASALNHPNICTVHEVNEHEGRHFIAMELVEGTPLDQRINGRPLPTAQLLELAEQIADALDAAHHKGIIHRDIKPANILVTGSGRVKVVDFGLAKQGEERQRKLVATSAATAGVSQAHLTSPGVALGTVAYMSPEQARGEPLDARTDLFSFGAVVYEMATGTLPFQGATSAVIFDAILNRDPQPPSRLNAVTPPELERIIHKALEKDRELRYQSAAEMRSDLRRLKRDSESKRVSTVAAPAAGVRRRPRWLLPALGVLVVAVGSAALLFYRGRAPQLAPQSQWVQLTDYDDGAVSPSVSPDGKLLTFIRGDEPFTTDGNIYVKVLPDGEAVQLTHDGQTKMDPVFSPDGSRIIYTGITEFDWQTWEVPVFGGEPRLLLHNAATARWIGPHELMFSEVESGIHMAVATASESRSNHRTIYSPGIPRGMAHRSYLSPDRKNVLVVEMDSPEWLPCRIVPFDGSSAGQRIGPLDGHCFSGAWSPDGKWIYFTTDSGRKGLHIWRQRFPDGAPEQLTFGPSEEASVTVAPDGKYLVSSVGNEQSTVWLHEGQKQTQLSSEGYAYRPMMSRDGKKAYFLTVRRGGASEPPTSTPGGEAGGIGEFTVADLDAHTTQRLFPDLNVGFYAISPDQKTAALIVRAGNVRQLWLAPLDQRSEPRRLPSIDPERVFFLSDTELLIRVSEQRVHHFYRIRTDGSDRREMFANGDVVDVGGYSPDGKWLGLWTTVTGTTQTTIIDAYNLEDGRRIHICSSCEFHWTGDGKYIVLDFFFLQRNRTGRAAESTSWAIPTAPGKMLPANIPKDGWTLEEAANLKGAVPLRFPVAFGSTLDRTLTLHRRTQNNLFRIPLR